MTPNNHVTVALTLDNEIAILVGDNELALVLSPQGALDLAEMIVNVTDHLAHELLTDEKILDQLLRGGEEE